MHIDVFASRPPHPSPPPAPSAPLRPDSYQASTEMAVVVPVCGWWVVFPLRSLQAGKRTAAYQALQSGLPSVTAYEKMAALFSRAVPGMTMQEKMRIWAWEISQQFPGPFSIYKYTVKDPFSFQVAAWLQSLQICHSAVWLRLVCFEGRKEPFQTLISAPWEPFRDRGVRVCVCLYMCLYTHVRKRWDFRLEIGLLRCWYCNHSLFSDYINEVLFSKVFSASKNYFLHFLTFRVT